MKKNCVICISIFIVLLISSSASSQTYILNIKKQDGTSVSFPIQDIKRITFTGSTNIEDITKANKIVDSFTLFQNHPNPFNSATTITFSLKKNAKVKVLIFDITGQLVREFSDDFSVGTHKLIWDGRNNERMLVASGLYIYTIKFENTILSKRMVFLK